MFIEGFLFGMLGQLTIGPVCLYILNTAIKMGLSVSICSVAGVTLADGVYILLALGGISGFVKNPWMQKYFRAIGGSVLVAVGLYIIYGVFGPEAAGKAGGGRTGWDYFFYAFLLTISNPITIIFWSGIFTVKISGSAYTKGGLYLFALGAALSTFVFLSLVSLLGTAVNFYFPPPAVKILNLSVGAVIVVFGVVFFRKRNMPEAKKTDL